MDLSQRKANRLSGYDYSTPGGYFGSVLFQRSYHDHIIRNEADYLKIWQRIDSNPAKWDSDCFYFPTA